MKKKIIWILLIFSGLLIFSLYKVPQLKEKNDLLINILGTIFGGGILAFFIVLIDEIVYKINITGEWEISEIIETPGTNPYLGYKVFYTFHILQKGSEIVGYGEKTKEIQNEKGEYVFEREKRVRVEFTGYIEKGTGFIKKGFVNGTQICFLIYEYGRKRETSSTYFLTVQNSSFLKGNYFSTAGDARGPVQLKKIQK